MSCRERRRFSVELGGTMFNGLRATPFFISQANSSAFVETDEFVLRKCPKKEWLFSSYFTALSQLLKSLSV